MFYKRFATKENIMIQYNNKRKDVTFCTMLFKVPVEGDLAAVKGAERKFEEFYLPSLEKLILTFKKIALWCDKQTADFIKKHSLNEYVDMHVIDFKDLPHYKERQDWLDLLHNMQGHRGFLFHHKTPESWVDYMILIMAKPWVMEWAAKKNKFKTKYFMWLDAGSFNPMYENFWANWDGTISAKPERVRITISKTLGKTRPRFVPNFIYRLYRKTIRIPEATKESLVKQNLLDIAMINADYDVPACSIMATAENVHKFYNWFETVRKIMKNHGLVSTEQAVFQAMMKFDTTDMFEVSYIRGYTGVYAGVAKEHYDCII